MAATGWFMNVSGAMHGTTPIAKIKSASYDEGATYQSDGADFDVIDTVAALTQIAPTVSFQLMDISIIQTIALATRASLTLTFRDAMNGVTVGGGALKLTMANAYKQTDSANSGHRQFGGASITFASVSTDGATHPVSWTAL